MKTEQDNYTKKDVTKMTFQNIPFDTATYSNDDPLGSNKLQELSTNAKISNSICVGSNNNMIAQDSFAFGHDNIIGCKAWYFRAIDFSTNTIYLTNKESERNDKNTSLDSEFISGYSLNDTISIVNKSKYDNCSKIIEVNGNAIKVNSLPFTKIEDGRTDFDDYIVTSCDKPEFGILVLGEGSITAGEQNNTGRTLNAVFGKSNIAFSDYAFVGGRSNSAGYASFVAGRQNQADGRYSSAVGFTTKAIGDRSFAEGEGTQALGYTSHAQGYNTIANNQAEQACGQYNSSTNDTIFSVGIGTSNTNRKNGLEVTKTGVINILVGTQQVSLQDKLAEIPTPSTFNGYIKKSDVSNAAKTAIDEINDSENIADVQSAMVKFLQTLVITPAP